MKKELTKNQLKKILKYNNIYTVFTKPNVRSYKRIGPHNKCVLDFMFGSLLGNSDIEKHNIGYKFRIFNQNSHVEYFDYSIDFLVKHGYLIRPANAKESYVKSRINKFNKQYMYLELYLKALTSIYWLYDIFYINNKKVLPSNEYLNLYLTPLALAVMFMNDGHKYYTGFKLKTNQYSCEDNQRLSDFLNNKYNLTTNLLYHIDQDENETCTIFISYKSFDLCKELVYPYLHPSMYYKLDIKDKM